MPGRITGLLIAGLAVVATPGRAQDRDPVPLLPYDTAIDGPTVRQASPPSPRERRAAPPSGGRLPAVDPRAAIRVGGDPERAVGVGVAPGPPVGALDLRDDAAAAALVAFGRSCAPLMKRDDLSGLTAPGAWGPACDAAKTTAPRDAARFFETHFETVQVGDGAAFATGYFEPEIMGSRQRLPGYDVPIYRRPPDLIDVDLGQFASEWAGKRVRGKVEGTNIAPYATRAEIDDGALAGRGLELAWAADYIDLFFLQVQGSGRLRAPDGRVMRIGYAGQNGHDYTGIGRLMRTRGLLAEGKANMAGIVEWLRANPAEGIRIMRENKSAIFFRELTGPDAAIGPLGAMGAPVVARVSMAADPRYVPLGAPVIADFEHDIADGFWVVQDTGGAIKGANRFDTFWGAGEEAKRIAGGMSSSGRALVLLPKGSFARLAAARR